jgi:hypothetical protein
MMQVKGRTVIGLRYGDIRYHGRYHSKGLGVFNTNLLEISGKKLLFFHFF